MCSHRRKKNTEYMLDYFLEGFGPEVKITKKRLVDSDIKVCIACEYCRAHLGECIHKDDMSVLIQDMLESDLIVIATPLYCNSVTSLFKIMIDRTQTLYNAWHIIKKPIFKTPKPAVLLSAGGSPAYKGQFSGIEAATEHFFKNINSKVIDTIRYNNTDRISLINNAEAAEELRKRAETTEAAVRNGSW